jgi:anaerobic magnesium-protoporphyrin IX monomethyl ester cyclase
VQAMAQRLIDEKVEITWAATMRADQGIRLPEELWHLAKKSGLRRLLVGVESGDDKMLKRIRKDITISQVYQVAERMRDMGLAGNFPFIVGFPDETDESVAITINCVKRLRAMSPDFDTPIFYFKPYPGSAIVTEAVNKGFRLPDSLAEWSTFDFVAGLPGPWVTEPKYQLIERFKFFQELAWKRASAGWDVLQRLARYRCQRDEYRFPIEMNLLNWLQPRERLS